MQVGTAVYGGLSEAARTVLIGIGTSRQGAKVTDGDARVCRAGVVELDAMGLIGQEKGLTRRGGIVRDRIIAALEDEAF